ncbi:LLM class oxidoreductase [Flindersiella endophytica]
MRLGLTLGYWSPGGPGNQFLLVEESDRLGYDSAWVAEAYGSDAVSVLGYLAGRTQRIDLGAAVLQIPARQAAMTGMTAATLDLLTDGRFRLGLGVSGPQVSEGWYGMPFAKPLGRTREYVEVVRSVLRRETVQHEGQHITLPLPDGPGKPLKLALRPKRPDLPIYLAAVGPANLELAGEIADGWLGVFVAPEQASESLGHVAAGRAKAGKHDSAFDAVATVPVVIGDDLEACAEPVRGYTALYLGGMGSRKQNFYNALAVRMGYGEQAKQVQELYLAGNYRDAMAAVPQEFIDRTALLGPPERIADRLHAYAEAGVTTISVLPFGSTPEDSVQTLRTMADVLAASGLGG